ncbi:hypothetical protein [Bradyrhizobium sp. USDA 4353]
MTSISASSMSGFSPLDLLKQELTKEVSAGKVSSTDQTALSSALDDIDSALKSGSSSSSSSTSSTPPSPKEMQSKIDDLIQSEVDSGKLTSDQATELKNVFANAFSGGPGGAGGPPPDDASSTDSTSITSSSDSSDSSSQVEELLKKLLEALQSSNSSKTSSYSASGTSSSTSTSKSLVVDFSA